MESMGPRLALVVGIDIYPAPYRSLAKATTDAGRVAGFLEQRLGFDVTPLNNRTASEVTAALLSLVEELTDDSQFFFYFAGHGLCVGASPEQSLLCSDASKLLLDGVDSAPGAISPKTLITISRKGRGDMFFCLDVCRTQTLQQKGGPELQRGGEGLRDAVAYPYGKEGKSRGRRLTMSSCADGEGAFDDGSFAKALVAEMGRLLDGGHELELGYDLVKTVTERLNSRQTPDLSGTPFVLVPKTPKLIVEPRVNWQETPKPKSPAAPPQPQVSSGKTPSQLTTEANAALKAGRYEEAERLASEALKLDSSFDWAQFVLTKAQGRLEEEKRNSELDQMLNEGWRSFREGDSELALTKATTVLKARPDDPAALGLKRLAEAALQSDSESNLAESSSRKTETRQTLSSCADDEDAFDDGALAGALVPEIKPALEEDRELKVEEELVERMTPSSTPDQTSPAGAPVVPDPDMKDKPRPQKRQDEELDRVLHKFAELERQKTNVVSWRPPVVPDLSKSEPSFSRREPESKSGDKSPSGESSIVVVPQPNDDFSLNTTGGDSRADARTNCDESSVSVSPCLDAEPSISLTEFESTSCMETCNADFFTVVPLQAPDDMSFGAVKFDSISEVEICCDKYLTVVSLQLVDALASNSVNNYLITEVETFYGGYLTVVSLQNLDDYGGGAIRFDPTFDAVKSHCEEYLTVVSARLKFRIAIGVAGFRSTFDVILLWGDSSTREAGTRRTLEIGGVEYGFVWIPAGEFDMGSPESEKGRRGDERLHRVKLTKGFWMLETPTTQTLYREVMGTNPSLHEGGRHPVERVSWDDATKFCRELTKLLSNGLEASLPTEAQWEYACRAGTKTAFYWGNRWDSSKAVAGRWISGTTSVKTYAPNGWGLYDMLGNVWEWTSDYYARDYPTRTARDPKGPVSASYRASRGGGWSDNVKNCRSARRDSNFADSKFGNLGFRFLLRCD